MTSDPKKQRVIIIGAGPAGLTAGYEILKTAGDRFDVQILEASDAIGGISRTVVYNGNRMDIGGHRFFSKDASVMRWWEERLPIQGAPAKDDRILGPGEEKPYVPGGPDPEKTDLVMLLRRRVSRIYSLRKFFDYPISFKAQTFRNLGLIRTLEAGFSYLKTYVVKLPETSLENFYCNRFGRKLYALFFESYTEKVWGRHPSEISADWGAQRVKGLSIRRILADMLSKILPSALRKKRTVETSLIESFWYPKLGPGQLWEKVADEIRAMGGEIRMNRKAVGLTLANGRIASVIVESPGGEETLAADAVFSSMPLKDLIVGIERANPGAVPAPIREIAACLPYRDFITVGLQLKKLLLKNRTRLRTVGDRIPDCWIYVQEPNVRMGRIQVFNNWSPYLISDFEKNVGIGLEYFCAEGDDLWTMSDEAFSAFAIGELEKIGVAEAGDVLDWHVEHVQKAYPAYFDTYDRIGELTGWLDGIANLSCIGRNGQHRYNNTDHSMVTAFEAVKNLCAGLETKANIWNVNTEKSYHESVSSDEKTAKGAADQR